MITATKTVPLQKLITGISLPVYSILFYRFGAVGLAWASDIGIGANLLALALLLHRRKLVPLGGLRWGELGKAALTGIIAGAISFRVAKIIPLGAETHGTRMADVLQLALVSVTWAAAVAAGLWLLRSELPQDLRRRKRAAYGSVAHAESKEILESGREP